MLNMSDLFVVCFWNKEIGILTQSSSVYDDAIKAQSQCDDLNNAHFSKQDNITYRVKRLDDYLMELSAQQRH